MWQWWNPNSLPIISHRQNVYTKNQGSLIGEDITWKEATKPMCHNYWACALEPWDWSYWAQELQVQKSAHLKPVLSNKRSHCNEKPPHLNIELPQSLQLAKSPCSNKDPAHPKINKLFLKIKIIWATPTQTWNLPRWFILIIKFWCKTLEFLWDV